ncbi:MAG: mandelate racemase/muconate lactonizing enzyme family protein [Candidatus Latescibacteria bacterium]|nr:mandelate racemase/muconate lactonizing enzyme family protein [Candidatus Latescibacterota bacterium]
MKITAVELFEIEIPPIAPVAKYMPKIYDITLCRIETDEGIDGWGEYQGPRGKYESATDAYVGQDPLKCDPFNQPDFVTCALLDIWGKAFGVPVNRFFGQKIREKVPVSYWSCPMDPQETALEAVVGAELGFTNHKLKGRSWNIVETIRLVRDAAGPDYTVGVDPNREFRLPHVAARLAEELEQFGTVANLEDPMLKNNYAWYRLLREKTTIPIALHMGDPAGVLKAAKAECVDYVNLGGPALQVRKAAAVAEAAEMPCWVQMGGLCLGILATYSVHVQSTIPNATLPCDELPFMRIADVLDQGLEVSDGHFTVPVGPGLGVTVNMDVVDAYRVA